MTPPRPHPRRELRRPAASCVALSLGWLLGCGSSTAPEDLGPLVLGSDVTDVARIALVVPSGALSGDEIKAHSHFRTDGSSVPIYAPVDMRLTQGTWVGQSDDYGLIFQVSARYRLLLGHVTDPRQDIVDLISRNDPSSRYAYIGPLSFSEGELIGFSSGTAEVNGIDFGLYDLANESITPNTPRYRRGSFWQKRFSVCPYDHFSSAVRGAYLARFGTIGGVPVPNGPCRKLADQSVEGTVSGEWTLASGVAGGPYGEQFAVGTHLDRATVRIAGIGGTFDVVGGADPKTVTDQTCYAAGGSYVFLRMTSQTTLDVIKGDGACPSAFPAGSHRSYER